MTISAICACKNRNFALEICLNSWLNFQEITEIIIVDWSSDKPLEYLTKLDSRIKVIRVSDKKYFNLTQPLNLAASIASGDYILKLDTDYLINPYYNFIEKYLPDQNSFYCGDLNIKNFEYYDENQGTYVYDKVNMSHEDLRDYINSYSPCFRYLNGLLFVSKHNFDRVGGYNENIENCYSYDDDEMIQRLILSGLEKKRIDIDYSIIHLPHSDKKRIENHKGFDDDDEYIESIRNNLSPYYNGDELQWQIEYALTQRYIEKNIEFVGKITDFYLKPRIKWNVIQVSEQNYIANEVNKLEEFPSVYYVSIEESVDRRQELEKQFSDFGISVNSIISKRFSESDDKVSGKYLHTLNDGTKGCCVSHLKAIKYWYENTDDNYGFFCEDDLSLETVYLWNFTWIDFIETIPEDAECVQLFTIRDNYNTFQLRERYWDDWGVTAYIITRDYAKKIIDTFIKDDYYYLEIPGQDVMPLIENILFASVGKTYTIPLFVENIKFNSTFVGYDEDVKEGQKTNHKNSRNLVLNYWKSDFNTTIKEKSDLENLLTLYALDTENPEHNFNLGIWYEKEGHTAPALSYYLRCAERSEDQDLAYEALIRGSYCYDKQKERDGSSRSLLFQAQAFRPDRPEAYYLLSRYAERKEWWQDCYINADLALRYCNFDCNSLRTSVEYPGRYGLLYEKAVSGWWWGRSW